MFTCKESDFGGLVKMKRNEAIEFLKSRGKPVDFLTGVKEE